MKEYEDNIRSDKLAILWTPAEREALCSGKKSGVFGDCAEDTAFNLHFGLKVGKTAIA